MKDKDQYRFDSSKYKECPMLVTRNRETGILERTFRGKLHLKGTQEKIESLLEEWFQCEEWIQAKAGTIINADIAAAKIIELVLKDLR